MNSYILILKDTRSRGYDVFAWFIAGLNLFSFLVVAFFHDRLAGMTGAAAILLGFIMMRLSRARTFHLHLVLLLAPVIPWLLTGYFWFLGPLSLLLALLFYIANKPKVVRIHEEGIQFPSFPPRSFSWNEMNNSVLKDGLLTLDLKNNKLIQQLTEDNPAAVNEKEFNEFCREHLKK